MKRYIIVLVALLSLTACKISDGHHPDKNEVDRLLYNRASSVLSEVNLLSSFAIYAEIYMSKDESAMRLANTVLFKDYYITEIEDGLLFQMINKDGVIYNSYKLKTDGKKLSEGVVWELTTLGRYNQLSAQYATRADSDGGFYIEKVDAKPLYSYGERDKVTYHFDFKHNVSIEKLAVVSNISGLCSLKGSGYTLDFTIQSGAPAEVLNCSRLERGVVDIKYKDLVLNTEETTTAIIEEKQVYYE